jgi:phage gp29-like protein
MMKFPWSKAKKKTDEVISFSETSDGITVRRSRVLDIVDELLGSLKNPMEFFSDFQMANMDEVLRQLGYGVDKYFSLLYDGHLSSIVQQRKDATLSREWKIDRDEEETAETKFIKEIFTNHLKMKKIISEGLDAALVGYKPMEIMYYPTNTFKVDGEEWHSDGGFLLPFAIVGREPQLFGFSQNNHLIYNGDPTESEVYVNKMKVILFQKDASAANPYGRGVLSRCWWPRFFKKEAIKDWPRQIKERAVDPMVVQLRQDVSPNTVSQKELDDAHETTKNLFLAKYGVLDKKFEISRVDSGSKTGTADNKVLINVMNAEMSKAVLSQTLTTEQGSTGSYSMSKTHMEVREEVINSDCEMIEEPINEFIKNIIDINFPNPQHYPKFKFYKKADKETNFKNAIELIKTGTVRPTERFLEKNGQDKGVLVIVEPQQNPSVQEENFSEFREPSHADYLEDVKKKGLIKLGNAAMKMFEPLVGQLEKVKSEKEYNELVEKSIGQLDNSDLIEVLEQVGDVAEGTGYMENSEDK